MAFFVACPLMLRVTRRGESILQVVGLPHNRPLAKYDLTPAMYDKGNPANINPNETFAKSPKETWSRNKQGLPFRISLFLGGLV